MNNIHQTMCMVCRDKNNSKYEMTLQNAKRFLIQNTDMKDVDKNEIRNIIRREYFTEHISYHCRYGLMCLELQRLESQDKKLFDEVLEILIPFIQQHYEDGKVYEVLRYFQGYLPKIYVATEKYASKLKNNK